MVPSLGTWFAARLGRLAGRGAAPERPPRSGAERLRAGAFAGAIAVLTGTYLALQVALIRRLPLVMDEFDGAYDVYRLSHRVPYLHFRPYKTVLGYYLELPPLLLADDVWTGLIATKLMLAGLIAASMAVAAFFAAGTFQPRAVVFAFPLWIFMTNWLDRSSELRVDTLTALAGVFSLLLLLRDRPFAAGFAAGLSFLVSQKGIYYFAGALAALGVAWVIATPRAPAFRRLVRFGTGYAAPTLPYLALFGVIANFRKITEATFFAHYVVGFTEIYPHIRKFWTQSIDRNPFFYALGVAGLCTLAAHVAWTLWRRGRRAELDRDLVLLVYALVVGAGLVWHKQPWPYFFVLLVPTAFVVHTAAIEHVWRALDQFVRPFWLRAPIVAALLAGLCYGGAVLPAGRVPKLLRQSHAYQRSMVEIAAALLKPGETYLACVDLLYDREQSPGPLRRVSHLSRIKLARAPREKIRALVEELRANPPKLVVRNERHQGLPFAIRRFLDNHYADFWGSIRLYAPRFNPHTRRMPIAYAGVYQVTTDDGTNVLVNDEWKEPGTMVRLGRGAVSLRATSHGRLRLAATRKIVAQLDPRFRKHRALFPAIYSR